MVEILYREQQGSGLEHRRLSIRDSHHHVQIPHLMEKETEAAGRWRREAFLGIAQAGRGGKSPGSKPTEMDFTATHLKAELEVWLLRLSRNAVSKVTKCI